MPIIIVEGADGAGKTTLCKQHFTNIHNSIYLHFPIRNLEKDVIAKPDSPQLNFTLCKPLRGLSMSEIQDVILDNIITNSYEMMRLHELDVTVVTDRYILSNIAYRKLHLDQQISIRDIQNANKIIKNILAIARLTVLLESPEVLYARTTNRDTILDELDKINEEKRNIELANTLFAQLSIEVANLPLP